MMGDAKAEAENGQTEQRSRGAEKRRRLSFLLSLFTPPPLPLAPRLLKADEPVDAHGGKEGGEAADVGRGGLGPKGGSGAQGDYGRYRSPSAFTEPPHRQIDKDER